MQQLIGVFLSFMAQEIYDIISGFLYMSILSKTKVVLALIFLAFVDDVANNNRSFCLS